MKLEIFEPRILLNANTHPQDDSDIQSTHPSDSSFAVTDVTKISTNDTDPNNLPASYVFDDDVMEAATILVLNAGSILATAGTLSTLFFTASLVFKKFDLRYTPKIGGTQILSVPPLTKIALITASTITTGIGVFLWATPLLSVYNPESDYSQAFSKTLAWTTSIASCISTTILTSICLYYIKKAYTPQIYQPDASLLLTGFDDAALSQLHL